MGVDSAPPLTSHRFAARVWLLAPLFVLVMVMSLVAWQWWQPKPVFVGVVHPQSPVKGLLTVSIGVAVLDARDCHQASQVNLDGLYRLADAALYRAKSQGRNQVVLASEVLRC